MIDPLLITNAVAIGFGLYAAARWHRAKRRHATSIVMIRAHEADAAELNRLLDRRADHIDRQGAAISKLSGEKAALQLRVQRFEDEEAGRQAQRVAASKRAAEVNRANAAKRRAAQG